MGMKHDETKLGPRKWNPPLRKRAKRLAEADADHPIAEALRKAETVVAEAARKTAQVGLEENYIGVFATAQVLYKMLINVGYNWYKALGIREIGQKVATLLGSWHARLEGMRRPCKQL